ncbi:hypothetical protein V1U69_13450 [Vibrio alginolyticus]|uniref:hypothetical protein n=1 Tax=Vibrio alginolyticus TaxID=663 RepID=UPI0029991312|nr:hypothetical protein [Vibrio parahaemolyticus]
MLNLDDKLALLDDYLNQFSDEEFAVRLESHGRFGPTAVSFAESFKHPLYVASSKNSVSVEFAINAVNATLNRYLAIDISENDKEHYTDTVNHTFFIPSDVGTFGVCFNDESSNYAA